MGFGTEGSEGAGSDGGLPRGLTDRSRGIWAFTVDVDLLRRLASGRFDWVAVDAQHGSLTGPRCMPSAGPSRTPAPTSSFGCRRLTRSGSRGPRRGRRRRRGAVGDHHSGCRVRGQRLALSASRRAQLGPVCAPLRWSGPRPARRELRRALPRDDRDGRRPDRRRRDRRDPRRRRVVRRPFDLALALGTTVDALLDDRSPGSPLGEVVAAAERHGILVAAFAGTPANARRLRAHGIHCLAVTTDLAVVDEGVRALLESDDTAAPAHRATRVKPAPWDSPRQGEADHEGWP